MTQAHAQETLDSRLFHLNIWSKSFSLVEEYRRWSLIIVNQTYIPKTKVTNCIWFFSIIHLITHGVSINFLFFRLSLILRSRVFHEVFEWKRKWRQKMVNYTYSQWKTACLEVRLMVIQLNRQSSRLYPANILNSHGPIATADLLASSLLCAWPTRDLYHFISIHTTSVKK